MKKILTLIAVLAISVVSFAQEQQKGNNSKKYFERIQSEKIAFFTNELDLTPEEAQAFWPVYNMYSKEKMQAHFNTMKLFKEMNPCNENLSDAEKERRIDSYVKSLDEESKVLAKYNKKFKSVLPMEKVAKLYKAEESFRIKMINGLRKGPQHGAKQPQKAK